MFTVKIKFSGFYLYFVTIYIFYFLIFIFKEEDEQRFQGQVVIEV